jgi:hypothetical protein
LIQPKEEDRDSKMLLAGLFSIGGLATIRTDTKGRYHGWDMSEVLQRDHINTIVDSLKEHQKACECLAFEREL